MQKKIESRGEMRSHKPEGVVQNGHGSKGHVTVLQQGQVEAINQGVSPAVRDADQRLVQRLLTGDVTYK